MSVVDIANVVAPNAKHKIIGIRPGEKLHEQMIGTEEDATHTFEFDDYYKILPAINNWSEDEKGLEVVLGSKSFSYTSDNNSVCDGEA